MTRKRTVQTARTLESALAYLHTHGRETTVLAGGTDLMVGLQMQPSLSGHFLNIWGLDDLRGIRLEENELVVGALSTHREILESSLVATHLPALAQSARTVGARQIQNRGTLGGNLANASPAADTAPVLLAADASVELVSQTGRRRVALDDFFLGYKQIARRPDELLAAIRCPVQTKDHLDFFCKVGTRRAQAISKVVIGARARFAPDGSIAEARLALGSVAATTVRLPKTEQLLQGGTPNTGLAIAAAQTARQEITPIDDVRSTADYRRQVTGNLAARFVRFLEGNRA